MSGVKRVFVEKKKPFAVNAKELLEEIGGYLGIKTITDVRVLIRYDIENLSEETYKKALTTVFSEPPVDDVYEGTFPAGKDDFVFSVEYLPRIFQDSSTRELILQNSVLSSLMRMRLRLLRLL